MKRISEYSAQIEKELRSLDLPEDRLPSLYSPIFYALSSGGKRIRPSLLAMAADAFGGNGDAAMRPALGIEMFHNFTLLHDDVIDCSDLRRGRPTVCAKWDTTTAILSGDTMLTLATQLISEVDDAVLRPVLDTFNGMAIKVYEGQQMDIDFEKTEKVTVEEYIRMVEGKTGALLGASAMIGALIGGASREDAQKMYEYGNNLGIAFQIQDDWLDVFGDSATFGKPIGGDINNNKKSYLLLSVLEEATPEAQALAEAMKLSAGPTKVKTVTRLYERAGVSDKCREAVAYYSSRALAALKATSLSEESGEEFRRLVDKLTGRKK